MKHITCLALCLTSAAALPSAALAQSTAVTPPPEIALCTTCHGVQGLSQLPNAPHIAGHPEMYIAEQLKAYRSGKRQHEVMAVIAKTLTDAQIEVTARWYASFKIKLQE